MRDLKRRQPVVLGQPGTGKVDRDHRHRDFTTSKRFEQRKLNPVGFSGDRVQEHSVDGDPVDSALLHRVLRLRAIANAETRREHLVARTT